MSDRPAPDRSREDVEILVVDDEEAPRELLTRFLQGHGYGATAVADGESAERAMKDRAFDLVFLDLELPDAHGLDVLRRATGRHPSTQFLVVTGHGSVDSAVTAMRQGAFDYLTKPVRTEELLLTIRRALADVALREEVARLRRRSGLGAIGEIVGRSEALDLMLQRVERVAPTNATVLITGETGTGKELVARALHQLSPRADGAFVPVVCSALSSSVLESELFGHRKGSFTGAAKDRKGMIETSDGGTLFLDEVSTIPPSTQVMLLRALEQRAVTPVGASREVPVDFRLVAATNRRLEELVRAGEFREDLYYRLNVFPIRVPALRERADDIPRLARSFRLRFARSNDVDPPAFGAEVLERMATYPWPGNVRELENYVTRAL
ncbi:MAG TPA: sigma-54 dependent transcriptional regulator, partial [Longimicrobiales bacterium]|nr:sigma-54 dependent transcriptional regulator [Longimicrobiales bacterium]